MNKIYKVIWSKVRNCYVAVSEIAKRNGKSCTSVNCGAKANRGHAGMVLSAAVGATLLAGVCSVLLPVRVALAAPVMPTLDYKGATADVTIASTSSNTAATMNITSTKTNNVLKWIDFSIGKGGAVNFTDAHNYLNYVTGHGRSEIDGALTGAGKIYIVNPNGVLFGDNARVDVGSLYVSTRELGADQFSAFESGNNPLTTGDIKGDVVNLGKLNANNITVEGNNISFKNVADVTKGGTLTGGDITGNAIQVHNDISVTLTANSTGEIHIGSSNGGTPGYSMNGTSKTYMYKLVSTPNELQAIGNNDTTLAGNYMLANDIDLKNGDNYYPFKPIGYTTIYKNPDNTDQDVVFKGRFDGLNYIIKNLKITDDTLPSDLNMRVGLFGYSEGTIENVGVVDTDINVSKKYVGGVVGYNHKGTVRNVYHTGSVSGESYVGGISGYNYGSNGYIEKAFNSGTVTANADNISSDVYIGGIVGSNVQGKIREVYNTGDVGTSNSYNYVGGIADHSFTQNANIGIVALIENSYNTGTVKGYRKVGGIAGSITNLLHKDSEMIKNTYNTGTVEGDTTAGTVGGLVGYRGDKALITSSYFNNGNNNGYGTLKTNQEMHDVNTYSGWSISTEGGSGATWRLYQGINGSDTNNRPTPLLTAFLKPKDLVQVYEYDGNERMFRKDDPLLENDTNIKHSGVAYPNWKPISLKDAGVDDFSSENGLFDKKVFYSLQNGYDIADMKLIIQPKKLTADFNSTSEVYKGSEVWEGLAGSLVGVIPGDEGAVSVTSTATFADKNVGTGKTVTYSDITLDGDKKDNYIVVDKLTGTGAITKKELTLVADKVSIKKDGTVPSNFTGRITGFVPGESLGAGDTLTFALTKDETPAAVGFYGVTGKLNDAVNGDYGTNYTFTNDPANASAFSIVVGVMPKLDFKGASPYVTIASTPDTMNISSLQTNNVLKWMDFSIDKDGTVNFDTNNYLNYVTGHGRSEIDGTLTGGGNIYLINPNGMVFGSNASVNVGNLYLSTRSIDDTTLKSFDNNNAEAMNPLSTPAASATGDIVNLGTLTAANITAEGNNISFKNVEDVRVTDTGIINVRASGEVHVGYAASAKVDEVNDTEYTVGNITLPDLSKWSFKGLDNSSSVEPTQYMLVRNAFELQNMKNNLTGNYMLANDIEFRKPDNSLYIEHFQPIGRNPSSTTPKAGMFQGRLDGLNHVISDITIDVIDNTGYSTYGDVGMIGSNAGVVENLGVINGEINVPSFDWVGGIVGANKPGGIIRNVYFTGSVTGSWGVGGIAGGQNQGSEGLPSASIEKAYNAGKITGRRDNSNETCVGGIVGINWGTIKEAYNTGTISYAGTKGTSIGGIAGKNENNGTLSSVENVYNAGNVIGTQCVGGIVGYHQSGTIKYAYNTGVIRGDNGKGGIVGYQTQGSVDSSYFTKGGGSSGIQIDDSELKQFNTFAGSGITEGERWNMSQTGGAGTVWRIYEGQTAPLLTAFLKTKDVITETEYNRTEQSFDENLVTGDSHITATVTGETGYAKQTDAKKDDGLAGSNVLYSDQLGYDLVDTKLIIQPKRVSLVNADKTYDGTTDVNAETLRLNADEIIGSDSDKVTLVNNNVTGTYSDKNVGDGKAITYTIADDDGALTGTAKGNYIISAVGTGDITAKTLNLVSVSKVYDGTANVEAGDIGITETDIVTNDINKVTFDSSKVTGSYADKNVGTGKNVTYTVNTGALTGTEAGNYVISTAGTGEISKADVTLTVENVVKTYDGTTAVTGKTLMVKSGSGTIFDSDSLGGGTFAFTDKNVGDGNKTVTVGGGTITDKTSGVDTSGNYNITYADNTTSTINQANITLTAEDVTKTYDGTTTVAAADGKLKVQSGTIFAGDSMSGGTFAFTDKNVGDGNKTVTVTGATISDGTNSGNYNITYADNTTSTINKADITLTAEDVTKTYDGTTTVAAADGKLKVQSGTIFTGDSMSGGTFAFTDKNVGDGNKTVTVTGATISDGTNSGNYNITYADNTTSTINKADITLTAEDVTKTYDGTTTVAAADGKLKVQSGTIFTGDSMSGGTFAFTDKNVGDGNKTVTVTGATISDGTNSGNYNITYADNTTSTINKADITLTAEDVTKTYDGTTTVAAADGKLKVQSGTIFTGDSMSGGTFAFTDKNVGDGNKTVTVTGATISDGTNSGNYNITYADNTTSTINKADITLTAEDVTKTYDGTTTVAAADGKLKVQSGTIFTGDSMSGGTFAFTDKNVGDGNKTVTVTGATISDGTNSGNYNITYADNTTSTINKADITLTAEDVTKTYDGTTTVAAADGKLKVQSGTIFIGDSMSGGTFAFTDKNVGDGNKTVTVTGATISDGTNSGNYNITYADNTTSTINKADITLTAEDVTKTYDGTTTVAAADGKLKVQSGTIFTGDSMSGGTFAFTDKNVGDGNKTVTVTGATISDGTNSGNYNIIYADNTTSTINKADITLTAEDVTKTYDGTTTVAAADGKLKVQSGTIFTGDSMSGGTFAFTDKNVGDGNKTVTVTGATISDGTNSGNYNITYADNTTSTINKADITLTAEDVTKTYDGTTTVAAADGKLKVQSGTIFTGDSMSGGTFAFTDKNVGDGNKTVTVTGATISDGTNSGNYNITYADNTTSTITPKAITATFADITKVYDGTTDATAGVGTLSGVETIDKGKVSVSASAAYDEKNAGSRIVNYSGVALSGDEASNYSIATTTTGAGTITPKTIAATFADISKVYDGTTNATPGTGTLSGVIAADEGKVNVSASAAYDEKNAGNRTVNYTGVALSGPEAANYSIATTATGNGSISRKALELVADPVSIQKGDSIPVSFTGSVSGFAAGEGLGSGDTLLFTLADLSTTAAGSYGITGTINGSASGNYRLNYTFSNAASNANAFVIYDRPASVQNMVLSDLISGIKGTPGADISVMALDNSLEQATDKKAEAGIEFAVAQTILSVDADRNLSLENQGMKQPPAMTPQEVAEQVHAQQGNGNGVAAQSGGNADAASVGANENGAASNMGVAGAVNAAMDVVQQADNAVGTEESKRKKGVA